MDISNGLKQALELGISQGIDLLSQKNSYYGSSLAKILFPEPLQKVDNTLKSIDLGSLSELPRQRRERIPRFGRTGGH